MKNIKKFFWFLDLVANFLEFGEFRCLLFWYSPEKNSQQQISRKKNISWNQGSCHQCRLVRFWSIIFIYGLSDIAIHLDPIASISRKKKKYFLWKSSQPNNYPPLKKNQMKIPWKKQIKTTRVSSAFRRKKINGARKEIFLNEKKKQLCMMLNYNCSKKHTWWNDIYSLQFLQQQQKKTISRNFWRRYIFVFLLLLFCFHFLIISFHYFCPCHLITKCVKVC